MPVYSLTELSELISQVSRELSEPALIAIDGRCAAGKTSLAEALAERIGCPVFHMDDFFLPRVLRTPDRLRVPGSNFDSARLIREILDPLSQGQDVVYRPFDCRKDRLGETKKVLCRYPAVIEGSYSLHPKLRKYYRLTVFLDIAPDEQRKRLRARSPELFHDFVERWIPLEEQYIAAYAPERATDIRAALT